MQELVDTLRPFSRESVISLCSFIGILLKFWDNRNLDLASYDHLLSCAFESLRGDWYKLAARHSNPEFVFHRRQLLLITKLAALHCPEVGVDAWKVSPGFIGTILLMANDHFHYDLSAEATSDEHDKIKHLFAELISVCEGAGFRVEHKIVRSHLMLKFANQLRDHHQFIDIAAEFQKAKQISLVEYEALCFALFAKCATLSLEDLQHGASAFTFTEQNFNAMAIPKESAMLFLDEITTTLESLVTRIKKRDYGSNDFTELRKRPLVLASRGYLPIDLLFLAEKFESGPYWAVNDVSTTMGDRLRKFWGPVFEAYMNDLLADTLKETGAVFVADPRNANDPNGQICDGLILQDGSLVLLEYKSSMFTAETKYSGNVNSLVGEIEKKLVRDKAESKKKGVEQLADAVALLFGNEARAAVTGIDLSGVSRVYPLLITLDGIGGSLLISRLLNRYFSHFIRGRKFNGVELRPLFCTEVESIEQVSGCFQKMSLARFLDHWLSRDPNFMATLTAFTVPELNGYRNERMAREWRALSDEISARAFPAEYAIYRQGTLQKDAN